MASQNAGSPAARRPVGPEVPVVDLAHLRRQPGVDVHAVGDVADRHVDLRCGPDRAPSTSRATPRRAATRPRWRAARSSARAPSCRTLRRRRCGSTRPEAHERVRATARARRAAGRGAPRSASGAKRSCPAGTGVCVVKTTCARDAPHRLVGVDALRRPSAGAPAPARQTRCGLR